MAHEMKPLKTFTRFLFVFFFISMGPSFVVANILLLGLV